MDTNNPRSIVTIAPQNRSPPVGNQSKSIDFVPTTVSRRRPVHNQNTTGQHSDRQPLPDAAPIPFGGYDVVFAVRPSRNHQAHHRHPTSCPDHESSTADGKADFK
ncbi:hypothetical protein HPP92_021081 [Vanilla planifolia]|uniref:Uncharacterized protein n=1 Tax=Vanilla planifolia TaxID=51239 RepID=A0A835PY87_VANPL|nr:hypothetical protein HPP92_021081 [Vanilla planifolia]